MEIDLNSKEEIFTAIKALRLEPDKKEFNQGAHNLASLIVQRLRTPTNGNPPSEIQMVLDNLGPDSSDDDLRAGARVALIWKLRTMDLKASEYGQLKDLLSPTEDNRCRVIDFSGAILFTTSPGFTPDTLEALQLEAMDKLRELPWTDEGLIRPDQSLPIAPPTIECEANSMVGGDV